MVGEPIGPLSEATHQVMGSTPCISVGSCLFWGGEEATGWPFAALAACSRHSRA
jgi:hypothetical protein